MGCGLDFNDGEGPPLVFETMVFGGDLGGSQVLTATWEEAEAAHEKMVKYVKQR